jgi:hypothetical protein
MNQQDKRYRIGRPSPAMVVAMTALVIALTGSAYAAFRVPPNSVGSRQLKAKSVTGGKIANATISGGKIETETITGANIKMSALGVVPSAANAANAANAATLGAEHHSASCPEHTTLIRGICFDSHSNPVANSLEEADEACAAKGGWLPTPMELYAVKGILNLGTGSEPSQQQYTGALFGEVSAGSANQTVVIEGAGNLKIQETDQPSAYYCVYPLVR